MRNKFHYNSSMEASERDVQKAVRDHERSFQRRFPMLKGVEMEHRWGGRFCLSCDNVPVFVKLEENMFASCCQNGVGVSKGTLSGIQAVEYACGLKNPYIED
jgi:glycine/D-amino acid oxidase-like deaminating enzyme